MSHWKVVIPGLLTGALTVASMTFYGANHAPVASTPVIVDLGEDGLASVGERVTARVVVYDPDRDHLQYTWLQKQGPVALSFSGRSSSIMRLTIPPEAAGHIISFQCSIRDAHGGEVKPRPAFMFPVQ